MMILILTAGAIARAQAPTPLRTTPDVVVPSKISNVTRGQITADLPPVAHLKSGQTVKIETISHGGLTPDPVANYATAGIPASQVLPDVIQVAKKSETTTGFTGHVLTGPIYVDGAEPGDMLEIRIVKLTPRVPYGVNNPGTGGVVPGMLPARDQKIIKLDMKRNVALFSPTIEVPMQPFLGIMAVATPPSMGTRIGSRAPGIYGGNIDFKALTENATLYLPVFRAGGLFVTGDSHAVQGDGEVDGNALEASLDATLQIVVHKQQGASMKSPRAEDADNYYVMGIHPDLDSAMKIAVEETIDFLGKEKGLSKADAYSLSSIAIDYGIAEAVDQNLVVYGRIPKRLFKTRTPYWADARPRR